MKPIFDEAVAEARKSAIQFVDKQEKEGLEFLKNEDIVVYEPTRRIRTLA